MPSAGFVKTETIKVSLHLKKYKFPNKASEVEIQNSSACDVVIKFDDDLKSQQYTLRPLQKTPILSVQGGQTTLKYFSYVEGCKLELLMWG